MKIYKTLLFTLTFLLAIAFVLPVFAQELKEKEFYQNKFLAAEGERYTNEKRDGKWILYSATGKKDQEGVYANGLKQGLWKRYDTTSQTVIEEAIYLNDSAHGVYKSYYTSTHIAEEGFFDMGVQVGEWKVYYDGGNKHLQSVGSYKNGQKKGKWVYYIDAPGLPVIEICEYENNLRQGQSTLFYDEMPKAKKAEGNYNKGAKNGVWTFYHKEPNTLQTRIFYTADIEQDTFTSYYAKGAIQERGSYLNGNYHGLYQLFYENGQRKQEGAFLNGLRSDEWKFYYETGVLKILGGYYQNKAGGIWKYYRENGSLEKEQEYKNGVAEGLYVEYFFNGKVFKKGTIKNQKINGKVEVYDVTGNLMQIEIWEDGVKIDTQ